MGIGEGLGLYWLMFFSCCMCSFISFLWLMAVLFWGPDTYLPGIGQLRLFFSSLLLFSYCLPYFTSIPAGIA
jgi:hypothetical protein